MQVANSLNNTIRILFNPKVEAFKMFDFLIVKSKEDRYLAQIIEIYDDKYDSSQNVAKLKLFYKIAANNEVMPYDNFTPNKECEITKVNQEEIEAFINQDKKTFIFATNTKNSMGLNLQYDFFNNNPIILSDKIENSNAISLNLAKNLSEQKHAVILDFTGILEFEGAKIIKAAKNFKMPLNYDTIDFVSDECLKDSSLEFQAIGLEIITEIKKFAKAQEDGFIPFTAFTKVLIEQYKATPYPELKLFLSRIKKFQMDEIFARNKKETEALLKTIEKNPITILDLSGLKMFWQNAYVEYIISALQDEIYLISRVNDELFDIDLINKIYTKKKNIKFIPSLSYNFSKLPSIIQYCKNYILMPSLYQRNDFLDANFALCNLISEGCILFGQNTDNFLYLVKDYELEVQEKRKNYRKIALSLTNPENTSAKEQVIKDTQNFLNALSEAQRPEIPSKIVEEPKEEPKEPQRETKDEFPEIENAQTQAAQAPAQVQAIKQEPLKVEAEEHEEVEITQDEIEIVNDEELSDFVDNLEDEMRDEDKQQEDEVKQDDETPIVPAENSENDDFEEIEQEAPKEAVKEEIPEEEPELPEEKEDNETKEDEAQEANLEVLDGIQDAEIDLSDEELDFFEPEDLSLQIGEDEKNVVIGDVEYKVSSESDSKPEKTEEEKEKAEPEQPEEKIEENIETDEEPQEEGEGEEEIEEEPEKETEKEEDEEPKEIPQPIEPEVIAPKEDAVQNIETKEPEQQVAQPEEENEDMEEASAAEDNDLDLSELANNAIDNNFDDILNSKTPEIEQNSVEVDDETKINMDISTPKQSENLPIFKEKVEDTDDDTFWNGEIIMHSKYGKGKVIKIIQYDQRQLLQIEFEDSSKKLLDPKVADIKKIR